MIEAISEQDRLRMDPNRYILMNLKFFQHIFEIKISVTLKCSVADPGKDIFLYCYMYFPLPKDVSF